MLGFAVRYVKNTQWNSKDMIFFIRYPREKKGTTKAITIKLNCTEEKEAPENSVCTRGSSDKVDSQND